MQVQPYLTFNGRCEEAVQFYQKALGAEVTMLMRFKESPVPAESGMVGGGEYTLGCPVAEAGAIGLKHHRAVVEVGEEGGGRHGMRPSSQPRARRVPSSSRLAAWHPSRTWHSSAFFGASSDLFGA